MNTGHDFPAFLAALVVNCTTCIVFLLFFLCAKGRFPQVYMNNARSEQDSPPGLSTAPFVPGSGFFGWASASWRCTSEQAEETIGLDNAMFLEFLKLSLHIVLLLAVPLVFMLAPLHVFFGGGSADLHYDVLAMTGIQNVLQGSNIYWVHAGIVWYVIIVVQMMVYQAQQRFLPRRFRWLKRLPPPSGCTVMVEGIPSRYCSESALHSYFSEMFPASSIASTYVAKDTTQLQKLLAKLKNATLAMERAAHAVHTDEQQGEGADSVAAARNQEVQQQREQVVEDLKAEVEQKRGELEEKAQRVDKLLLRQLKAGAEAPTGNEEAMLGESPYSSSGFVTFKEEREAMLLLNMQCSEDQKEFMMSAPPDPSDVIYSDLLHSNASRETRQFFGNLSMVAILAVSLPAVTAMAYYTRIDVLKANFAFIRVFCNAQPKIEHILRGLLQTAALAVWASFLPTVLMWVLYRFFPMRAHAWAQVKLQRYYFWMMVTFFILVTAVGSNPAALIGQLVASPLKIFGLLGDNLPKSSDFYLFWITIQWVPVCAELARYPTLMTFLMYRVSYDEDVAIELSEPEDQEFYGLGGRSARNAIQLAVALIFSSLTPMILVVSVLDFVLRCTTYGYLLVFAETRKPDLGGVGWVLTLRQVQQSLVIYWVLMIGVLAHSESGMGPVLLAAPAIFYWAYKYSLFHTSLRWESLPFHWVCSDKYLDKEAVNKVRAASRENYYQDELRPPGQRPSLRKQGSRGAGGAAAIASLAAVRQRRNSRSSLSAAQASQAVSQAASSEGAA